MSGSDPWTILGIPQATWMGGTFVPSPQQWDTLFAYKMDAAPTLAVSLIGVVDGSNAPAGLVGEYISSIITIASAIAIATSGTPINVTSISLSPGDWDLSGQIGVTASAGCSAYAGGISPTSATLLSLADNVSNVSLTLSGATLFTQAMGGLARARISLTAITTYYLVASATFASGTAAGYGKISARRVR